jgi:hypothetical protein
MQTNKHTNQSPKSPTTIILSPPTQSYRHWLTYIAIKTPHVPVSNTFVFRTRLQQINPRNDLAFEKQQILNIDLHIVKLTHAHSDAMQVHGPLLLYQLHM